MILLPSTITDSRKMKEDEFTKTTVVPLLKYLGYSEVTYTHGVTEFGKDILFSEYDRFGNKIYHAAQVKVGNISGNNKSGINDLIDHIVNAFSIDFSDLITKNDVAICHFFVITSGKFVGNAPTKLLKDKRLHQYRHRLHFYERHHIEDLFEKSLRTIKELCTEALNEIQYNSELARIGKDWLLDNRMLYSGGYITVSIDQLIIKLSLLHEIKELVESLRLYRLIICRNNNLIALIPVLKILRGSDPEEKDLLDSLKRMVEVGDELTSALQKTLAELEC